MNSGKWLLEVVWWVVTVVFMVIVLLTIYTKLGADYPFYKSNMAFIAIAVTAIRYMFLLKHHWVSSSKWIKALFMVIPIPIFFYLIGAFYEFQSYSDEQGLSAMMTDLPYKAQLRLSKYIHVEMVFFFAAAMISTVLMPFRMLISIWREINKGTH